MLRLEAVSKRYETPDGYRIALDAVTLALDPGQMMGLFGPSGAGKSTLLRIAAGLCSPDSGTVVYDGERLDQMSAAARTRFRRREIACVWATQHWQERLGVLDHVALPLLVDGCGRRIAERRVREALHRCNAEQCAGMELRDLSDGERQRVALARALSTEPRLLLADGPTSSLSIAEREEIMMLLSALAREARVAVLVTAADAQALLRADPVLYLREGKVVGPGRDETDDGGRVYHFPTTPPRRAATDA